MAFLCLNTVTNHLQVLGWSSKWAHKFWDDPRLLRVDTWCIKDDIRPQAPLICLVHVKPSCILLSWYYILPWKVSRMCSARTITILLEDKWLRMRIWLRSNHWKAAMPWDCLYQQEKLVPLQSFLHTLWFKEFLEPKKPTIYAWFQFDSHEFKSLHRKWLEVTSSIHI